MDQPAEVSGAGAATGEPAWDAAIDWQDVGKQAAGGATIKQLHSELAPEASYTRFSFIEDPVRSRRPR